MASIAGTAAGWAGRATRRDLPFCPELARTLLHGHRYDGSLATRELGLAYRPIEETVERTIRWYAGPRARSGAHGVDDDPDHGPWDARTDRDDDRLTMTRRPRSTNLALELVRVTEAAALAAGRWIGHGDKIAADAAAVDAMRLMIDTVSMHGTVVIGEGEKDEAPMLFNGEEVGDGSGPGVDVAVDPIDGTRLTALGQPNALAVIALAERGSMFFPGAAVYMEKVATGPEAAGAIDITASPEENVRRVAKAKGVRPEEIAVTILDRERHADTIAAVRGVGARVFLITDGDVAGAIAAATPRSGVDLLLGIGGTPEGVISAAALKCLGGAIQGRLWPRNDEERATLVDQGFDLDAVLTTDDMVSGREVFFAATGITDGSLLRGVKYWPDGATTYSMVMRSQSGTVRYVEAQHQFQKLERFSAIPYRR